MTWKAAGTEIDVTEEGVVVTSEHVERRFPLTPNEMGIGKWTAGDGSALVLGERKPFVIAARGVGYHYETRLPVRRADVTLPKPRFEELICAVQQRWRAKYTRHYRITGDVRAPLQKYFDLYRIPPWIPPSLLFLTYALAVKSAFALGIPLAMLGARFFAVRWPRHRLRISGSDVSLLVRTEIVETAHASEMQFGPGGHMRFPSGRALFFDCFDDELVSPAGWPWLRFGIRRIDLRELNKAVQEALSSRPCAVSPR